MTKKRVLIIYTGGTIGMQNAGQGYRPVDGFADLLARRLEGRTLSPLPDYDLIEFDELLDSANLHPEDWSHIATTIIENAPNYDGFIILHGTDTMAYTASMLSFMLQGLNKPVIVTGAQIPLIELRNDAFSNVVTSLILAGNYHIPEVCLYFNGRLLRGNRARKLKSTGFDAFDSPNFPHLGEVGINIDIRQDLVLPERATADFHQAGFQPDALAVVRMYPGICADMVKAMTASPRLKAIIIQSYGVGNPPDKNRDLIDFLEEAHTRGIVVVNVSQCIVGAVDQGVYATGSAFSRIGVVPGGDMTLEAAFTKLHYLISKGLSPQEIRKEVRLPYCGECCQLSAEET